MSITGEASKTHSSKAGFYNKHIGVSGLSQYWEKGDERIWFLSSIRRWIIGNRDNCAPGGGTCDQIRAETKGYHAACPTDNTWKWLASNGETWNEAGADIKVADSTGNFFMHNEFNIIFDSGTVQAKEIGWASKV